MSQTPWMRAEDALPEDAANAALLGRVWRPDKLGPSVVAWRDGALFDITNRTAPTIADVLALDDPTGWMREAAGEEIGHFADILANSDESTRDTSRPWLLAPADLQAVKAAGVTFIASLLERVIEEKAQGSPEKVKKIRAELEQAIGTDFAALKPGSIEAEKVADALKGRGMWSQYLEVGIGQDPEVFTKCQPLSAVGTGAYAGIRHDSHWNNPEPEIVLAVSASGRLAGAALGNDVNLRDFEGRSALLLPRAKDNNASCAIGPFIRLFDDNFTLDDVRQAEVALEVRGEDGFLLHGTSSMTKISRDPAALARATMDGSHQYPDGFLLMLGTMFVPVQDRGGEGKGFTHKPGDIVTISTPLLGKLRNRMQLCKDCAPWRFGISALMRNLGARELI